MNHLVDLLCLCLLCLTGKTLCDKNEPPVNVEEDSDVVLPCSLSTKEDIEFKLFVWRKVPQKYEGWKEVFQYNAGIHYNKGRGGQSEEFKGRVSHFQDELKHGDASITIRNTKMADSGEYSCYFPNLQTPQTFYIKLVVGEPSKVIKVEEDSDVVLPCALSTKENITSGLFDWKKDPQRYEGQKEVFMYVEGIHYNNGLGGQTEEFKGRVSHFQDELKHGNASITIRNTKMADSGVYSCYFPRLQTPQIFYIKLDVVGRVLKDRSGENIPGAAPKPFVAILDQTKDRSLLQCDVHGDPEPEVEWRDSAGNKLPAETQVEPIRNLFYVTLRTTVTQTDRYRCVATQKTISHQVSNEISVITWLSPGWIILIVVAVVVAVVAVVNVVVVIAVAVFVKMGYITLYRIKGPSLGWIILIVVLTPVAGVLALMMLVYKGYIILDQKKKFIKVKEGRDVTLPCSLSTKEDLTSKRFIWRKRPEERGEWPTVFLYEGQRKEVEGQDKHFQGRVEYFPEELKQGNVSIKIKKTTKADSGYYVCDHLDLQNPQLFIVQLVVVDASTQKKKKHDSII
ncbi:butyrophilin subfamily 1 member A1 isoform X3 [Etheostoma spectabile]|uniref:butyrophilin subfamily 1 member A1 isoform X3 n=1 Tax=Etheostoma spectabile TaxID=54343 RepID=UPI0013AEBB5E|nr:butyrophilin subfamily 1 member A1-like isoform X3 [Etheostoma spectabile]